MTDTTWINSTINSNIGVKAISGLLAGTQYQWHVRTRCNNLTPYIWSNFTSDIFFTTPSAKIDLIYIDDIKAVVYPNPAHDLTYITMTSPDGVYQLNVYDLNGEVLLSRKVEINGSSYTEEIDVAKWPAGLYAFSISGNNKTFSGHFVRQ